MNNFKKQIIFVFQDSIKAFVAGAIGFIGIAVLRLLAISVMKLTEETAVQFLLNGLEIIHVTWTLMVVLIFAVDSLWRLIILLYYGAKIIESKK